MLWWRLEGRDGIPLAISLCEEIQPPPLGPLELLSHGSELLLELVRLLCEAEHIAGAFGDGGLPRGRRGETQQVSHSVMATHSLSFAARMDSIPIDSESVSESRAGMGR